MAEVAIVGAGITGLACAAALRGQARITVVDRIPVAGGVHGWRAPETAGLVASCGAELRLGVTALRWNGRELLALGQNGAERRTADALVVATGARPLGRAELGIAGPRPAGIVAATVACHLAENGLLVGLRPLVVGGGDWARAAALALLDAGARRVTVVAPDGWLGEPPSDRRIDVRSGDRVVSVAGEPRIDSAQLASGGDIACDALVLAHGLVAVRNVDGAVWDGERTIYAQPLTDPGSVAGARAAGTEAALAVRSLLEEEER
jgi:thioredoxin reductase